MSLAQLAALFSTNLQNATPSTPSHHEGAPAGGASAPSNSASLPTTSTPPATPEDSGQTSQSASSVPPTTPDRNDPASNTDPAFVSLSSVNGSLADGDRHEEGCSHDHAHYLMMGGGNSTPPTGQQTLNDTDALGRVTSTVIDYDSYQLRYVNALGGVTTLQYAADTGNIATIADPGGNTTSFEYTAGRVTEETDLLGNSSTTEYNSAGLISRTTDRNGRTIEYAYDAAGRPVSETWIDATNTVVETVSMSYNEAGRILTAENSNGTYTFSYDTTTGNLSSVAEPFGVSMQFAYDTNGNRTAVSDSFGGVETSSYGIDNRLMSRSYSNAVTGGNLSLSFMGMPGMSQMISRYSGSMNMTSAGQTTRTSNVDGQLGSLTHTNGSFTPILSSNYNYDIVGRLTSVSENGSTRSYQYDATDQLVSESENQLTYSYDTNGNRTGSGYSIGTGNRLLSDGT